ncbi:MAG: hypothetical protein DSY42_09550 [Aquifex sp.]|nr:MAG: hypothetical protein DSY42_09550 [Aquifex sp.]
MITVVINGSLYENIDLQAVDELGNPIYPELQDVNTLKRGLVDALLWLQNERVKKILRDYDYLDMGDLLDTANNTQDPDNQEAVAILNWYREYYTQIDNQISAIQNTPDSELLNVDVKALEKEAFNNALTVSPLP